VCGQAGQQPVLVQREASKNEAEGRAKISVRAARGLWKIFSHLAILKLCGIGIPPLSIRIRVFDIIPSSFSPKSGCRTKLEI
jgi:hypothetical protein